MKLHIIGAGGHAKVVIDSIGENKYSEIYFYDDKFPKIKKIYNFNIVGKPIDLPEDKNDLYFVAIGDNNARKKISDELLLKNLTLDIIINNTSLVSKKAKILSGTFVGPRAIINSGALIERGCIINTAAIIEHDCKIRQFVHIAPRAVLGGNVLVNELSLVGLGTIILPNVNINKNSIVKAGSLIKK
tara:strand:- start:1838 stop:2398 length:561 start_codon:yes stop_codon:yes gene_type:complete